MPQFDLNRLGDDEFESLAQSIIKAAIGSGAIIFGAGPDGGREATFEGTAESYPSTQSPWAGRWLFQAKFHDLVRVSPKQARQTLLTELEAELDKTVNKYRREIDNYILITNVPITGVHLSGTRDRIDLDIAPKYPQIKHIHVWGYDDISHFLVTYKSIREAYLHHILPGDILAQIYQQQTLGPAQRLAVTLRAYVLTCFKRDGEAQLDQAGEANDQPLRLDKVFIDIDSKAILPAKDPRGGAQAQLVGFLSRRRIPMDGSFSTLSLLLSEEIPQTVLLGGPGEGKSTIGQYLAQLHRAALLGKSKDVDPENTFLPLFPRIPLRVLLKDYAQWMLDNAGSDQTLEAYLASEISSMTGRRCDGEDLHTLLSDNPALLILDGLDEVTEPDTRTNLLELIGEFISRCFDVLDADIQVLATSRPTAYTGQFSPDQFAHVKIGRLQPAQISGYVEKWILARGLDHSKAARLRNTMSTCIADDHISILTNTPLQVTILILVILAGGLPPRQREGLFTEYLDLIYKRERAKSATLIQTEKQLLFGLHQYLGYLLHRQVGTMQNMDATLDQDAYEKVVRDYLKDADPYQSDEQLNAVVERITREAGQRFVLIVERSAGKWGFELRSIQEFFAAAHLVDTAANSDQRFDRFRAICRSPHWRNVSLYFAGRVGRSHQGEGPELIEVCRDVDRSELDTHLRRGSELSLEIAADRAFGPRAALQASAIEYGLEPLGTEFARFAEVDPVVNAIRQLSEDEIRAHVVPTLKLKLDVLDSRLMPAAVEVLSTIDGMGPDIDDALDRFTGAAPTDSGVLLRALTCAFQAHLEPQAIGRWLTRAATYVEPFVLAIEVMNAAYANRSDVVEAICESDLPEAAISEICALLIESFYEGAPFDPRATSASLGSLDSWQSQLRLLVLLKGVIGEPTGFGGGSLVPPLRPQLQPHLRPLLTENPSSVQALSTPTESDFGVVDTAVSPYLTAMLWIVHFRWGHVTEASIREFLDSIDNKFPVDDERHAPILWLVGAYVGPLEIVSACPNRDEHVVNFLLRFTGSNGSPEWTQAWSEIEDGTAEISDRYRRMRASFGEYADIPAETAERLDSIYQRQFGELASEGMRLRRVQLRQLELVLSPDEFAGITMALAAELPATSDHQSEGRLASLMFTLILTPADKERSPKSRAARRTLQDALDQLVSRSSDGSGRNDQVNTMALRALTLRSAACGDGFDSMRSLLVSIDAAESLSTAKATEHVAHLGDPSEALVCALRLLRRHSDRAKRGAARLVAAIVESPSQRSHFQRSSFGGPDLDYARSLWRSTDPVLMRAGLAALQVDTVVGAGLLTELGVAHQNESSAETRAYIRDAVSRVRPDATDNLDEWLDTLCTLLRGDNVYAWAEVLRRRLSELASSVAFDIGALEPDLGLP